MAAFDDSGDRSSPPTPRLNLANAHFVTGRVAFGGDLSPLFGVAKRQLQEMADAGITHIADLRQEWSDEPLVGVWQPRMRYLHHPVRDAGQVIPGHWFTELNNWVSRALEDPAAKVLVHCHMGVNRAPSAAFALLLAQGWTVKEALTALRAARPVAVIDYASDALAWHLERQEAGPRERGTARRALTVWRQANRLDPGQVIRKIRSQEPGGSTWLLVIDAKTIDELAAIYTGATRAVWLPVDTEPHQLAQLDEVLLWCADPRAGSPG
ncbi:MAG: dual specificity protein phosphatase, partial [Micropruina sp.]